MTTPAGEPILAVHGLAKHYGGVAAVQDCSFSVRRGSITGLVGPNGAGKSTAINLICGLVPPDAGVVVLDGEEIQGRPLHWTSKRGLIRTFQVAREWPKLTVLENVLAAAPDTDREALWRSFLARRALRESELQLQKRALEIIGRLNLSAVTHELAGRLSGGQKRLLEFARAAMIEPRVLLLDEPLAGVNPVLSEEIARAIAAMRDRGTTVLVIEHNLRFVEQNCETVVVMAQGRVISEGPMSELRKSEEVVEAYLGTSVTE